jgi:hypothetical protein
MEVNIKYKQQEISTITRIQLKCMQYIPIFLLLFLIDFSFGQYLHPRLQMKYNASSYTKKGTDYKESKFTFGFTPEWIKQDSLWVISPQIIFKNKNETFKIELFFNEQKKYYSPFGMINFSKKGIGVKEPEDINKSKTKPFRFKLVGNNGENFEGIEIINIELQFRNWMEFESKAHKKYLQLLKSKIKKKGNFLIYRLLPKDLVGQIIFHQLKDTTLSVTNFKWSYDKETSVDYLSPWILEAKVDYEKRRNKRLFLISDGIPMRKKRHNWFSLVRNKILEFIPHPEFKGSDYAVVTGSSNANTLSLLMPLTPGGSESKKNLDKAYIKAGKLQSRKNSQRIVDILKNLPQFYVDNGISANTDVVLFFTSEWSYMTIESEELEQLLEDLPKSIGDLHLFHISKKGTKRFEDFDNLIAKFNKQDWAHSHDIFEEDIPRLDKIILSLWD